MNISSSMSKLACGSIVLALGQGFTPAQAALVYDLSNAVVATGPAGVLATTYVSTRNTDTGATTSMTLVFARGTTGTGCNPTCATYPFSTASPDAGGLTFQMSDANGYNQFGAVEYTYYTPYTSFPVTGQGVISGYGSGGGSIYTQLLDPAQTSFTYLFKGHSNEANQQVTATVKLWENSTSAGAAPGTSITVYSGSALSNAAGDWTLSLASPLGVDLMNRSLSIDVRAAGGVHTLNSFSVIPVMASVPEPGTMLMMGLGLVGLAQISRRRERA